MKIKIGILLIFITTTNCKQKLLNSEKKNLNAFSNVTIGDYSITIPSNYKIKHSTVDSVEGVIYNKKIRIKYGFGVSTPEEELNPTEKISTIDTVGNLIVKISTFYERTGDTAFCLVAYDWTSGRNDLLLFKKKKGFDGIDIEAKILNKEQQDTVMKIYKSLSLIHDKKIR